MVTSRRLLQVSRSLLRLGQVAKNTSAADEFNFLSLFDRSPDGIVLMEEDRVLGANPAALTMFRCTREAMLSTRPWELSPAQQPDGRPSQETALANIQVAVARGLVRFEWVHLRADGQTFPAEVTLIPALRAGRPVCYGTIRDLTERKRAEEALQRELAFQRALSDLGSTILDPESTPHQIGRVLLGHAKALTGSAHGFVSEIDPVTGDHVVHVMTEMHGQSGVPVWGGDSFGAGGLFGTSRETCARIGYAGGQPQKKSANGLS